MQLKDLGTDIQNAIHNLVNHYKTTVPKGGKIHLAGAVALVQTAVASLLKLIETNPETAKLPAGSQDQLILEAIGSLFDQIAPTIAIPGIPAAVETGVLDPIVKNLVLNLAEGAITALRNIFTKLGASGTPAPAGAAAEAKAVPIVF